MPQSLRSGLECWIAEAIHGGAIETPCLVFDLDYVHRAIGLFKRHLPNVRLFYSMKANSDPILLAALKSHGVGLDAASINEVAQALQAGFPPEDLILSNTVKNSKVIRDIFAKRLAATTVDGELDLKALALESTFHSYRPKVLVRIKLPAYGVDINLNEKFGCNAAEATKLLKMAHDLGMNPDGIHFHVGTQCRRVDSYRIGMETAMQILATVKQLYGLDLRTINVGGGFPDAIVAEELGGLRAFFVNLGSIVRVAQDRGFKVCAEPGRVISAGAGIAVSQVIGRNNHEGREWLYLDDGIYGLYSTAHYEKRAFEFVPLGRKSATRAEFVVAGPTCDSLDVIGEHIEMPVDIKPGDYVIAYNAGAYSISVKSHFNGMGQITTAVQGQAVVQVFEDKEASDGGM